MRSPACGVKRATRKCVPVKDDGICVTGPLNEPSSHNPSCMQ